MDLDGSPPKLSVRRALRVLAASEAGAPADYGVAESRLHLPNTNGIPMGHNNLYRGEYKTLLPAGLQAEGFTFHTLRHTFAMALFTKCEYPKVVQSLVGRV